MRLFKHITKLQLVTPDDESESASSRSTFSSKIGGKSSRSVMSSSTPQLPQPMRKNRRMVVSFSNDPKCIEIARLDDADTKNAQWLSNDELKDILTNLKKEGRKFLFSKNGEQSVMDDNDQFCFRGLEDRTLEGYEIRRKSKEMVREAVLVQQDVYGPKRCDPKRVAVASMRNSLMSRQEAVVRAKLDELFVVEYLANERSQLFRQ